MATEVTDLMIIFDKKINIMKYKENLYFKYQDFFKVFKKINRIQIKKTNKLSSTILIGKGRDVYVNVRGARQIILRSKLKNAEYLEEIFFETLTKYKFGLNFEDINIIQLIHDDKEESNETLITDKLLGCAGLNDILENRKELNEDENKSFLVELSENVYEITSENNNSKNIVLTSFNFDKKELKRKIINSNKYFESKLNCSDVVQLKKNQVYIFEPLNKNLFLKFLNK